MLYKLPGYINVLFIVTTFISLVLFIRSLKGARSKNIKHDANLILIGLTLWLLLQAMLSLTNVYSSDRNNLPPKIVIFGIIPTFIAILLLFATHSGRQFVQNLPIQRLMHIHFVRLPVELVLYFLFLHKTVPELMTFEGRNFDIIAAISAPLILYFGFSKKAIRPKLILWWNFVCLGLLINIVISALLSAPTPIQQFAFNQPNIAVLYFPFSWLPTFIVPIVLFSHLAAIYQLKKIVQQKSNELPTHAR